MLLWMQNSVASAVCAVALLGLAAGAEMDTITYIATRYYWRPIRVYISFRVGNIQPLQRRLCELP